MKRIQVNYNILILCLLVGGAFMLKSRHDRTRKLASVADEVVLADEVEAPPAIAKAALALQNGKSATHGVADEASAAGPLAKPLAPLPYERELQAYQLLEKKVFLTGEEQQQKERLLHDPAILRTMGDRLNRTATTTKAALEQNAAIDMLLEALRSGDSEVAVEVLRNVVTDGQVEDEKLDVATRENLAGVKAEVLFQWSALKPAQADELASWLPGPVSQKIWSNVVDAQNSNQLESAALGH